MPQTRAQSRGGPAIDPLADAQAAEEAARLQQLEQAASQVFKQGRTIRVELIEKFLEDNASATVMERFQNSHTQSAKLQLVWTAEFDPPLTATELLKWSTSDEKQPSKELKELTAEELRAYLEREKAPDTIQTGANSLQLTGSQILSLSDEDRKALAKEDGAAKRWLRFLEDKHKEPEVSFTSRGLASRRLAEAVAAGRFEDAQAALREWGNERKSKDILRDLGIEHSIIGHLSQPVRAMAHHISQRAHEHAHLPVKSDHAPERHVLCLGAMLNKFQTGRA